MTNQNAIAAIERQIEWNTQSSMRDLENFVSRIERMAQEMRGGIQELNENVPPRAYESFYKRAAREFEHHARQANDAAGQAGKSAALQEAVEALKKQDA